MEGNQNTFHSDSDMHTLYHVGGIPVSLCLTPFLSLLHLSFVQAGQDGEVIPGLLEVGCFQFSMLLFQFCCCFDDGVSLTTTTTITAPLSVT